ncbi:WD domain, G-beta repeat-containing protein, partial [Cardiosporidium cionae]
LHTTCALHHPLLVLDVSESISKQGSLLLSQLQIQVMHVAAISEYLPSKCIGTLRGHKAAVLCVQFNKDGTYCLSSGQDRAIILWNPEKELLIKEYKGFHNLEINDVCIFDDNSKFISVGGDKIFFMWDVATGQIIRKFIGHNGWFV